MSTTPSVDAAALQTLADGFAGRVLQSSDDDYEGARRVHNGLIDRRPAVIAECIESADVAAAVRFATANGLEIAVRGGGHNVAGRSVCDGGLMIDLSQMREVAVDAAARMASAQGGALWSDLNDAAAKHGLAVTGGAISSTGIGGYTLGGGLGWLMSTQGLSCDNLIGAQMVTAAGEVLDVTDETHPDLMWALRGGGGNFGVATVLRYRLHHQPMVVGGIIAHPIDAARDLLRFYRDAVENCPDEVSAFAGLVHAPDGSGMKLSAMLVCHTDPERADADLAQFLEFGSPVVTQVQPMPYPVMNTLLDEGYPKGALNYWLSSFTTGMSDALIDTDHPAVRDGALADVGDPVRALPRPGDADRPDRDRRPAPSNRYNLLLPSEWMDPADTTRNIAWTKETYAAVLRAPGRPGAGSNYLGDDQARTRSGRLRPELRPAARRQAPLRPRQRVPPEPQHRAMS